MHIILCVNIRVYIYTYICSLTLKCAEISQMTWHLCMALPRLRWYHHQPVSRRVRDWQEALRPRRLPEALDAQGTSAPVGSSCYLWLQSDGSWIFEAHSEILWGPGHADYVKNMITGVSRLVFGDSTVSSSSVDCHDVSDSTEAAQMDGAILVVSGQCDRPSEVQPDRPSRSPPEVTRLWWSYATDTGAHPVVPAGWCVPALRGFQLDAKKTASSKLGMLESCIGKDEGYGGHGCASSISAQLDKLHLSWEWPYRALQHRPVKRKHHPLPMCIWSSGSCPPTGLVLDLSKNWGSGVIAISQSLSHIHRFWEYLLTIMDPKEAPKNWRIRSKLLGHGLALILCSAIFQAGSSVMESASIIWTKQHFRTDLWPITIWIYMEVCKNPAPIRLVFHDPPWAIFSFHSKKR